MEVVNFINEKVRWIIGNGEKIYVWQCRWTPCKNRFRKPLSNIIDPNLALSDVVKKWNVNLIKRTTSIIKRMWKIYAKFTALGFLRKTK